MSLRYLAGGLLLAAASANAHQPVMDMAPRWAKGYGFQIRQQSFGSDELRQERDGAANPSGLERFVDTTWLEGVYTFNRAIRATIKIPYVDQTRIKVVNGVATAQNNSGLGDVIVGLPLKRYTNRAGATWNWGITPSIRVPTGDSSGDFPISDGSVDLGLSFSYSWESPRYYQLYDLYYWNEGSGDRGMRSGDSWGLDVNVGIHPWHSNESNMGVFLMWDVSAVQTDAPNAENLTTASGGDRVQTGPVAVFYRGNFMARAEYKVLAYERVDGMSLSRGDEFWVGFGFTF